MTLQQNHDSVVAQGGEDMLNLYAHNRTVYDTVYENAVRLLAETGKAATIHPTGKHYVYLDNLSSFDDELSDGCAVSEIPWAKPSSGAFCMSRSL